MTTNEMITKVEEYNEMKELLEEVKAQVAAIEDVIKNEMVERDIEEINLEDRFIVRYTKCLSSRFETKRFKEVFGEAVYHAYTKEVESRRFSISA